jgi:hypothetical protein
MSAQVPYLARLAKRVAGPALLRPPRQLFPDDAHPPADSPDRGDSPLRDRRDVAGGLSRAVPDSGSGQELPAVPGIAIQGGEHSGEHRAGGAAIVPAAAQTGDIRAEDMGDPAGTARPPTPRPAPGTPLRSPAPSPRVGDDTSSVTPAHPGPPADPLARPPRPLQPDTSQSLADDARGWPPGSSTAVPQRKTPVMPPRTTGPVPVTGQIERPATAPWSAAAAGLAASPAIAQPSGPRLAGPEPADPGPADQGRRHRNGPFGGEASIPVRPRAQVAGDAGRPPGPATARDLLPPPASAPRPVELSGSNSGGSGQAPRGSAQARVSIGTIEVTVVPPARPAAVPAREIEPPAHAPHARFRPPSLLAASAGAGRLRDGLRRWYGIAQG